MRQIEQGHKLVLKHWPAQYHGKHYGDAQTYPHKLQDEHERMLAKGYVEGPLHYVPHVVQSLGGVWKEDKGKWRTIVDATSSGVNPACVPLDCKYDMLADAVAGMAPGCHLSSFDLTDAFLNWPYDQSHSDLIGYRDTFGDYFRYRFLGFGGAQSPHVQQKWAIAIKNILNKEGLKHCTGEAADYSTFRCVMAYMDDFAMAHTSNNADVRAEQYASVLRVLADLGLEDKPSKRSPPAQNLEILGFAVDTVAQTVSITADRCDRLLSEIADWTADTNADVSRRDLASLIGKLQWVAQIAPGGQLHLRRAYQARDAFVGTVGASAKARWGRNIRVRNTPGLQLDLDWWRDNLPALKGATIYLANLSTANGFWKGRVTDNDAELDASGGVASEDIDVITTDASGYGGGAWFRHDRAAWHFDSTVRSPARSSNYRELLTAILSLERWGAQLRGRRVLIRTDNKTTMAVINKGNTSADTLDGLARRLYAVTQRYDIRVAARHIPGVSNGLADLLSRWHYDKTDRGDWQFDPAEFARAQAWLRARHARTFDVDACADPTGLNAQCSPFWSGADSCLDHDMAGMAVWCNADWDLLRDILRHFRGAASRSPHDTTGVFVVPEKTNAAWWRDLRGFRVLARYPAGTQLFTRPTAALTTTREIVRPAKWPVLLAYWPPAALDRPAGGSGDRAWAHSGLGRLGQENLLGVQLSGDGALDAQRLRHM